MSYQVLARKWRPRLFAELVGQAHVVQALSNGLDEGRLHHAFLFTGTRGVGKTTIARILAKSLNCLQGISSKPCGECEHCVAIDEGRFVDLLEIDAASRTKVDDTREILDNVQYAPARGRFKVYLIDEVHMLSTHSFNALLKTLEEPPEHVKFVLATTDPQKIPVTILSRCLQFNLRRLHVDEISGQLKRILEQEGAPFEAPALELLARAADGSMRDGLSLMDQALASGGGRLETAAVEDMLGSVERRHLHAILEALVERDAGAALEAVAEVFSLARDLGQLLLELAETLHRIGLIQQVPDYRDDSRDDWDQLVEHAGRLDPEDVQLYYQIAITGRRDLGLAPSMRTGCEMTLLRMFAFQPAPSAVGAGAEPGVGQKAGQDAGADGKDRGARPGPDRVGEAAGPSESRPSKPRQTAASPARAASSADVAPAQTRPAPASERPAAETVSAERWPEMLASLELNGSVRAVAGLLALESVHDGRLVFRCEEDDRPMITDRFRDSFRTALEAHIGKPVVPDFRYGKTADLVTPARVQQAELQQVQSDAEAAIDRDPVVNQLRAEFGAEVIEGSVRPADAPDH